MKKRTLLGLCLSIFSLFLFSCGIAESDDGSATLNVDTATIVQRSIKSANFELSEDEIFEKYAEYLNYELTAIVHYEIDGKSENKTFSLLKMNGKEAMELVNKLESMSGEDQESYFTDKFKSQTLTIENLPVGKTATFKMKIRQKIGFDVDLSQYEGLSESEISKDEYLAISKKAVSAKISESTDITIALGEYKESLDWEKDSSKADEPKTDDEEETTPVPWTVTGTLPNEYDDSLEVTHGVLSIFKKVGNTWNLLQIDAMPNTNGFTLDGNTLSGSGIIDFFSEGDTVVMTIILTQAELADGTAEAENVFVGRSKEITITKDSNIFNLGELKYEEQPTGYPAPDNTVATVTIKSTNAIDAKYAVIAVQTENGSTIFEEPFKPNVSSNEKYNYIGEYSFSGISAFADLADGTELFATLTLYRDAPQGEVIGSYKISHTFYTKIINEFDYHDEDATDTGTSGSTGTTSEDATLTLNLVDDEGNPVSGDYYCALLITESEATSFTDTDSMLLKNVVQTSSGTVKITNEGIDYIISKGKFYISIALFDDETFAWNLLSIGNSDMAKYSTMNSEITIDTADNLTFEIQLF
ncbi:MAG: hypothetical protein IKP49_13540 [Treponema sp.]|nr:hypothetical protein [Treponema sp.]